MLVRKKAVAVRAGLNGLNDSKYRVGLQLSSHGLKDVRLSCAVSHVKRRGVNVSHHLDYLLLLISRSKFGAIAIAQAFSNRLSMNSSDEMRYLVRVKPDCAWRDKDRKRDQGANIDKAE